MLDKKQGSYECVPEVAGDLESIETPVLGGSVVPPEPTMTSSPTTAKQNSACDLAGTPPVPAPTPWLRQLYWILYKNTLLLYRRPITIFLMIFSSMVSVLLSWPSGRDVDGNLLPDRDQCGAVSTEMFLGVNDPYSTFRDYVLTLNQSWSYGVPVMVMSLGPFVHAVCVFLLVRTEIEAKLVGVLRGLGVRESIYWMGWLVPFTLSSFLNSLLGAMTTLFIPVHVFRTVYFGGIFGSLFFLNLALTCASFFLAALCGGNRKLIILIIMAMGGVLFVPLGINQSLYPLSVIDYKDIGYDGSPGLVWAHFNTASYKEVYYDDDYETCENPILNEETGTFYKTEEERLAVTSDQMFFGCYVKPGFTSRVWNTNGGAGLFSLSMIPYFHFMMIYSNFLGFTGLPNNKFGLQEAMMPPEDLAVASSPNPSNYENSNETDLFPQGSTLLTEKYYDYYEESVGYYLRNGVEPPNYTYSYYDYDPPSISPPHVCPSRELPGFNFCLGMSCEYAKGSEALTGSPSVHDMFGYLFALSLVYVLMAAYWLQVFPAGNGARRKFYFFLDPRYWVSFRGARDKASDGTNNSVLIKNVSKSFGSVEAVKDLNLELKRGQVTALLGHNGAGKSTLTNILSCEMDASKGEVIIFGKSVAVDPLSVRCLVGICKQDDFLWPDLSAKEHLDIFAGLRGVDSESHDGVVQKWLESVDLAIDQHKFSGTFSGGMKRRLSVALSTVGYRPFLIFDEPTTGMDPVSRRYVWQHLDDIKEDRVVLLTTHAMEEADLLADEVAIMKNGKLAANGSPLELKAGYGSAIQFSVLVEKEDVATTEESIRKMFADYIQFVSITGSDAGSLMIKFEKIQNDLDGHREGIPVSTLTQFVAWLESDESRVCEYGFSNSSLEEVFINIARDDDSHTDDEIVRKRCCCFGSSRSYPTAINEAPEEPVDLEPNDDIITSLPTMNVQSQVEALLRLSMIRKWFGSKSIIEYIFFGVIILGTVLCGLGIPSLGAPVEIFQIVPVFALSVMLLSVIFPIYLDKTSGNYHFMLEHALSLRSYTTAIGIYAFFIQFIFGVILMTAYFLTPLFRETQFCEDIFQTKFGSIYCGAGAQSQYLDSALVARSPGGYGNMFMIAFGFALSMPGSVFVSSIIPGNYKFGMVIIGLLTLVACILPVGYIILTTFNTNGGSGYYDEEGDLEKDSNPILKCMKNIDPGGFCSDQYFTSLAQGYKLNCIGMDMINWEFAGFISLISLCAPKYASLLPPFGAFQMLVTTLFSNIKIDGAPFDNDDYCNGETQQICKFPFAQKMHRQHRNFFFLGAILLNAIGLCLFVWVRKPSSKMSNLEDNIEDESEEIARQEVIDEKAAVQNIVRPLLLAPDIDSIEAANVKHVAIDYKAKSESSSLPPILMHKLRKVYPSSGKNPPKIALKALDLHVNKGQVCALLGKNGSGKTTALKILATSHSASSGLALVDGFDVNCEKSAVFEKLGNCPQHDVIWQSLSVKDHLEFFAGLKGIPRGEIKESSHALAKAVGLGKPDVYNRAAGALSGGMRRRLSIAISLTGAPSVLLLDEPTTGLDPSTRNEIWNLISSFATSERAIIITTHMMIEADTLCNRIAIIANGELRVVATQQHLKDEYGAGYVLQLNLVSSNEENREKAMSFVRERLHPGAVLDVTQAKTLHIHLPKDINLDQVFAALYSPERSTEGCINQFLLSQSSLEDVFLACAR